MGEKKLRDLLDLSDTLFTEAARIESDHPLTRASSAEHVRRVSGTSRSLTSSPSELVRTKRTRSGSSALTEARTDLTTRWRGGMKGSPSLPKKKEWGDAGGEGMDAPVNTWERKIQRTKYFFAEKSTLSPTRRQRIRTTSLKGDHAVSVVGEADASPLLRRHSMEWESPWITRPPALLTPLAIETPLPRRISLTLRDGQLVLESGDPYDILEWLLYHESPGR